ncbi:MAG: phosphoribosylanthranilate isomerase [Phenylobacterium sp.]|jgi:phosphoribosylanthranilate isomerase|uniref:phosphoribosylanthranilate isomerase n=1 Tax=Phenylobacterium sp. TaxID=1871053 RepID=UPI002A319EEF|nr:phosphoribosylanthranilate isomerase [Phenylobacterium sp.]MDD3837973.1 phosphoribosylanthranilate isomerase [Phenylobacterium sp.]MDX9996532.1 phosphoribosylanthranilate isomerase [Phenylobacterium sp.]
MPGRVQAKICGVSTPEAVRAALDGGAEYLGLVFFPASPRAVRIADAARLAEPVRGRAKIVALTVDPDDALLEEIRAGLDPDFIQLHGKESPARVREVAGRAGAGVIKALPVAEAADLDAAAAYEGVADHLMFDAKPPKTSDRPGGHGSSFDWSLLTGRRFSRPWFLAGGLDPWNVADAVRLSGAPIADVSTGVERGPGLKDPALIAAFLDAVRKL